MSSFIQLARDLRLSINYCLHNDEAKNLRMNFTTSLSWYSDPVIPYIQYNITALGPADC